MYEDKGKVYIEGFGVYVFKEDVLSVYRVDVELRKIVKIADYYKDSSTFEFYKKTFEK